MIRRRPGPSRGRRSELNYTLPSKTLKMQVTQNTMLSADTHPAAEQAQLELLRRATVAQRLQIVASLSQTVIDLSRAALRTRYPQETQRNLDRFYVAMHHGGKLAKRMFDQERKPSS